MFKIIAVLFLVACIRSEWIREERIYNGNEAVIENHPWQAEINIKDTLRVMGISTVWWHESHCGGIIIGTKWIISAAHCFNNETFHYRVRLGSTKTAGFFGTVYDIKNLTIHPEYDKKSRENDIAIIELAEDIEYDDSKRAIKMVNDTFTVDTNQKVQTSGYGRLCHKICQNSERLMEISLSVISSDECKEAWPTIITNRTICAINRISSSKSINFHLALIFLKVKIFFFHLQLALGIPVDL